MKKTEFLTITEAVNEYGLKDEWIREAIRTHQLNFYLFGHKTRSIKRSELELWIESRKNYNPNMNLLRAKFLKKEVGATTTNQPPTSTKLNRYA